MSKLAAPTLFLVLALAAAFATHVAAQTSRCPGETTTENNQCFNDRLDRANADLARYVAAATQRLTQEAQTAQPGDTGAAKALKDFDEAEKAWARYSDAECGAVYDYWSAGAIRVIQNLDCQISLTRLHTHTIWRQWLTYMDSTPPILPEPPLSPSP
jgi:uncharacterized protein YecT (DUF1311 family)